MTRGSCIQLPAASFLCMLDKTHWISSVSMKQAGSSISSHPGVQKQNHLKSGKGDGNHVSIYSKCKSLEKLRDSFGCCSPSRGLQVPADLNALLPLSQGTFVKVLYILWQVSLPGGNSLAPGPQLQCTNAFSPKPD